MLRFGLVLAAILAIYWACLSGPFSLIPMIFTFGVISVILVLILCYRMNILDIETVPYLFSVKALSYFMWLFVEIIKANVAVVKAVLSPDLEISPKMVKVPSNLDSDIGRTIFANSITLTPGTVSVEMAENQILVHALLSEMSDPAGFSEMEIQSGWSIGDNAVPRLERKS